MAARAARHSRSRPTSPLDDAERFGLKVRTGDGEETVIGYDTETGSCTSTARGRARSDFNATSQASSAHRWPPRTARSELRILVDWSSVEVFGGDGQGVITDQIFPSPTSDGIQLFADGGHATLQRLKIQPLRSSWRTDHDHDDD